MAGRTISKELKAQIVSAYRQGEKMKNIAELYGVSYPTVSKLVRASVNSSVSLVGIKKACPKCGKDKHEYGFILLLTLWSKHYDRRSKVVKRT